MHTIKTFINTQNISEKTRSIFFKCSGYSVDNWMANNREIEREDLFTASTLRKEAPKGYYALRALMARESLIYRAKSTLRSNRYNEDISNYLMNGYVYKKDFLNKKEHEELKHEILEYLARSNERKMKWHNSAGLTSAHGSTFCNFMSKNMNELISRINERVSTVLGITIKAKAGSLVFHRHYKNDYDTLYHVDHMGISTCKWFYFPFGTMKSDPGFKYISKSHLCDRQKIDYINKLHELSRKGAEITARFNQDLLDKMSTLNIKSFSEENSLVIADTSGFHARGNAEENTERITIQGGIDNSETFTI